MSDRYIHTEQISLSIGEVARAFGVSVDTVRVWDGTALQSFRTPGNQRRFRIADNPTLADLLTPNAEVTS